jgi:hypothetical protein
MRLRRPGTGKRTGRSKIVDESKASIGERPYLSNKVLEREAAGYRVLEGIVVPISDATQIDAICAALESSLANPLRGVHEHLATSLQLLSDRIHPDYRNSIKEIYLGGRKCSFGSRWRGET